MIPRIPFAVGLAAEFLPDLLVKIAGNNAEWIADTIISTARTITGVNDADTLLDALRANPDAAKNCRTHLRIVKRRSCKAV